MKKIYIAGPMTGYPNFNFDAFHMAAHNFRFLGWEVFNPAEKANETELDAEAVKTGDTTLASEKGFDFRESYLWDVSKVVEADAVFMLKGWEKSTGAIGEHAVAKAMEKYVPGYQVIYESTQ